MRKAFVALSASACLMAGCAGTLKPQPPACNLYERQGMAVLPFGNTAKDPAAGNALRDAVLAGLAGLNPCPVMAGDDIKAAAEAVPAPAPAPLSPSPELRKKVAETAKCDTIMVGIVTAYTEDMRAEDPKRVRVSARKDENVYRWGCQDTANVRVSAEVRVLDAASGAVLWTRKTDGTGQFGRWLDLPWPGEKSSAPPEGWAALRARALEQALGQTPPADKAPAPQDKGATPLLYQSDRMVAHAREQAVESISQAVLRDFTGTWGWQPPAPKQPR